MYVIFQEKLKLSEEKSAMEKAHLCIEDLRTCKKSLSHDVERLTGLLNEAQKRAELYKKKFLQ